MTEWIVLSNFYIFSKRNIRYLKAALWLYAYSIYSPRRGRRIRYALCCLQWMDDLIDGDRKLKSGSDEQLMLYFEQLKCALRGSASWPMHSYELRQLSKLLRKFVQSVEKTRQKEVSQSLCALINNMLFDRERTMDRVLLTEAELLKHHHETFEKSFSVLLIALGSPLKSRDCPELCDLLGWVSSTRDLGEDLTRGLVNIPMETLLKASPDFKNSDLNFRVNQVLHHESVKMWKKLYRNEAAQWLKAASSRIEDLSQKYKVGFFQFMLWTIRAYYRQTSV